VFHNNDSIINQNSDAEDKGEEGDAIKRETQEVEDEQRERERGGYGNRNNQRFAPAQQKEDEQGHTNHSDGHMKKKLVGLFRSRFAIVPRHGHLDIRWNHSALERLHPAQDIVSDGDRIGSRPLGHRERNSGFIGSRHTASRALAEE